MDLYAQSMLFYAKQHRLTPSAVQSKTKTKKTRKFRTAPVMAATLPAVCCFTSRFTEEYMLTETI